MGNNINLGAAKVAKNDEFYTQYADIQKEINAYLDYNPNSFRDKTVLWFITNVLTAAYLIWIDDRRIW